MAQGKQTVTDGEIIEAMDQSPDPAFTTVELAEQFDMTVEGLRNRLVKLHEQGRIFRKKPSRQAVIWWVGDSHADSACSA